MVALQSFYSGIIDHCLLMITMMMMMIFGFHFCIPTNFLRISWYWEAQEQNKLAIFKYLGSYPCNYSKQFCFLKLYLWIKKGKRLCKVLAFLEYTFPTHYSLRRPTCEYEKQLSTQRSNKENSLHLEPQKEQCCCFWSWNTILRSPPIQKK